MATYKLKDDDIEHEYKNEQGFNWTQAAWAAACVFGLLLPIVVFAGMIFDFW